MATPQKSFPKLRIWIICQNLNERYARAVQNAAEVYPKPISWNLASKRIRSYLTYSASSGRKTKVESTKWNLPLKQIVRRLRRIVFGMDQSWERKILVIQKSLNHHPLQLKNYSQLAWSFCFQIICSHNHFKRIRSFEYPSKLQDWAQTTAILNVNSRRPLKKEWLLLCRILARDRFRKRRNIWQVAISRIIQARFPAGNS